VLIDVKSTLRVGDTLAPLVFMSNGTNRSNFAGNINVWPILMTFGTLSSQISQMASMHNVVMVTLLPIPIKNCNNPQKRLDEQ